MGQGNLNNVMDEIQKEKLKKILDLESRSKKPSELVVTENFTVDEVVAETYPTSFTPNPVIGGRSPSYKGGYASRLILNVSPDNKAIPVNLITFDGFSAVKAGDYISAKIPRYAEELCNPMRKGKKVFYFDRPFRNNESAIEIALLSAEGEVLRRERSVDFRRFVQSYSILSMPEFLKSAR